MDPVRIEIQDGVGFDAEPGEYLLREALRNRFGFPYDCNSGGCGTCQFEVISGEVRDIWEEAPGLSSRARARGRRLACQSQITSNCTIKVRLDDAYKPATSPSLRTARLEARRELTHDMAEYSFRCGGPAEFLPGQFAMLRLPDVEGDRAYSMSNRPNPDGLWQFIVRHVPGGQGSIALRQRLQIGDVVELDGPYGMAYLRPDAPRDIVCIGGGSGISPLKSICSAAVREPLLKERNITLFYGGRTTADMPMDRAFEGDALLSGRVNTIAAISECAADPAWAGERGMIHEVLASWLDKVGDARDFEYYFCGPPPMTDAVRAMLQLERKVPPGQLHADRFL